MGIRRIVKHAGGLSRLDLSRLDLSRFEAHDSGDSMRSSLSGPVFSQSNTTKSSLITRLYEFVKDCAQPKRTQPDKCGVCSRSLQKLQTDTAGSVMVEYTVLVALIAVGAAAAIYAIGPSLVARYQFMKMLIGLPFP